MKRKFDAKLRKVGNSYVITIPRDTVDRFELDEGDFIGVSFDSEDIKKNAKRGKGSQNQEKVERSHSQKDD